jgi:hypothetical protein
MIADASAARDDYRSDFLRDLDRLAAWSRENRWPLDVVPELNVTVSAKYRISKSLVPAWNGETGTMQFPAWRVAARKAAIAHELAHVFFPNGNRFLAEGLAVYLQAAIGGNPAFPNFGRPLHEMAHEQFRAIDVRSGGALRTSSHPGCLSQLDEIATPGPLTLRIGEDLYGEDPRGQAHLYPLAGSFVQFLIATHGLSRFRELYARTPLLVRTLNVGTPTRWIEVYGCSLSALEIKWASLLSGHAPRADHSPPNDRN